MQIIKKRSVSFIILRVRVTEGDRWQSQIEQFEKNLIKVLFTKARSQSQSMASAALW